MNTTRTHFIKIKEDYADSVLNGSKTFEVRLNDRAYQKGDIIIFTVTDNHGLKNYGHDLNGVKYEITYVLSGCPGIEKDYVVFGIKEIGK